MWQELLDILESQNNLYKVVEQLIKHQQEQIVQNNADEIEKINKKLMICYDQSFLLEKKRIEIVGIIAEKLKKDEKSLTLAKIKDYLPPQYQLNYQKLVFSLQDVLGRVKVENEKNKQLLEMSLRYIDFSLNLLSGTNQASYGSKGEEQEDGRKKSFLNLKV